MHIKDLNTRLKLLAKLMTQDAAPG